MKSFLYIQVKENDVYFEHSLIDCDDISSISRSKPNGEQEGKIVLFKKSNNNTNGFPLDLIAEVVTNNKFVARFFRNAGIEVELEELDDN